MFTVFRLRKSADDDVLQAEYNYYLEQIEGAAKSDAARQRGVEVLNIAREIALEAKSVLPPHAKIDTFFFTFSDETTAKDTHPRIQVQFSILYALNLRNPDASEGNDWIAVICHLQSPSKEEATTAASSSWTIELRGHMHGNPVAPVVRLTSENISPLDIVTREIRAFYTKLHHAALLRETLIKEEGALRNRLISTLLNSNFAKAIKNAIGEDLIVQVGARDAFPYGKTGESISLELKLSLLPQIEGIAQAFSMVLSDAAFIVTFILTPTQEEGKEPQSTLLIKIKPAPQAGFLLRTLQEKTVEIPNFNKDALPEVESTVVSGLSELLQEAAQRAGDITGANLLALSVLSALAEIPQQVEPSQTLQNQYAQKLHLEYFTAKDAALSAFKQGFVPSDVVEIWENVPPEYLIRAVKTIKNSIQRVSISLSVPQPPTFSSYEVKEQKEQATEQGDIVCTIILPDDPANHLIFTANITTNLYQMTVTPTLWIARIDCAKKGDKITLVIFAVAKEIKGSASCENWKAERALKNYTKLTTPPLDLAEVAQFPAQIVQIFADMLLGWSTREYSYNSFDIHHLTAYAVLGAKALDMALKEYRGSGLPQAGGGAAGTP